MTDVRVLTWNLFHGRDGFPGLGATWRSTMLGRPGRSADGEYIHVNRKLMDEMGRLIAGAAPSIAMLQEVPPGAVGALAAATGMQAVVVRTGPFLGPVRVRAALGSQNPDLWRTHEGNANVLLIGGAWSVVPGSVRSVRLNPPLVMARAARGMRLGRAEVLNWAGESRRLLAATVAGPGGARILAACTHCATNPRVAEVELRRARDHVIDWADGLPILVGGDLNVGPGHPALDLLTQQGFREEIPGVGIDHIFSRGLAAIGGRRWRPEERDLGVRVRGGLRRVRMSDHDLVEGMYRLP